MAVEGGRPLVSTSASGHELVKEGGAQKESLQIGKEMERGKEKKAAKETTA